MSFEINGNTWTPQSAQEHALSIMERVNALVQEHNVTDEQGNVIGVYEFETEVYAYDAETEQEIELEDMRFEQVRPLAHVLYTLVHDIYVCFIKRRCPDIIFIGKTGKQVTCTGAAIPDIIVILPILTEHVGEVLLAFLHPNTRRKI